MKKIIYILFVVLLSLFTFKNLFTTYFQQDEWHAFGVILADGWGYVMVHQSLFQLLFGGDRAGARILNYLLFSNFGLNIMPYFSLSLGLHFFNSFLVYRLTLKILRDRKIAYITLLFFLFNGASSQVYTWLGTFAGSVPNMTFLLLSLYAYLKFLFDRRNRFLYLSLLFLWISFLFKETGFFFLILYPVIYFIYTKNLLKTLKINIPFILYGIFLVSLRINEVLAPKGVSQNLVTGGSGLGSIFLNSISYPLQSFSQLILPPNTIYFLSELFSSTALRWIAEPNTTEFDMLAHSKVAPSMSVLITIFFLFILYKIIRKRLNNKYVFAIDFCTVFIFLSFVPYIVISKTDAYLEPRYYYNGTLASSILLGIALMLFIKNKKLSLKVLASVLLVVLLYFNIIPIREEINFQREAATERKYIINTIQKEISRLPSKVVFYVDGDAMGYYGLPELKIPFQSGLGQTLLVVYSYNKEISANFLREDSILKIQGEGFLYGILDQGYREVNGRGFGYFWDKKQMMDTISKYHLGKDSVYSFFYKSTKQELINNSKSVRDLIRND